MEPQAPNPQTPTAAPPVPPTQPPAVPTSIVQELQSNVTKPVVVNVDAKHQFDGTSFRYEKETNRALVAVVIIAVLVVGVVAYLLAGDPLKLIAANRATTSTSSTSSLVSSIPLTATSSSTSTVTVRDFASASAEKVTEDLETDFRGVTSDSSNLDFPDFDSELEFGL